MKTMKQIADRIEQMIPDLPEVDFTGDKTSVTVGKTTISFRRSRIDAVKLVEKLRKRRKFTTSQRAVPKQKFTCVDGPWSGQELWLDRMNAYTFTFTVSGVTGRYVGTSSNKCQWVPAE